MTRLKAKDIMTANPSMIKPTQTVKEAAAMMKSVDCGVLPVGEPDNVVGMITDRDIVLRVMAEDRDPSRTLAQDAMTKQHYSCAEDDDLETIAGQMRDHDVRRLLVTKNGAVSGVISLECLLRKPHDMETSERLLHALLGEKQAAARNYAA